MQTCRHTSFYCTFCLLCFADYALTCLHNNVPKSGSFWLKICQENFFFLISHIKKDFFFSIQDKQKLCLLSFEKLIDHISCANNKQRQNQYQNCSGPWKSVQKKCQILSPPLHTLNHVTNTFLCGKEDKVYKSGWH